MAMVKRSKRPAPVVMSVADWKNLLMQSDNEGIEEYLKGYAREYAVELSERLHKECEADVRFDIAAAAVEEAIIGCSDLVCEEYCTLLANMIFNRDPASITSASSNNDLAAFLVPLQEKAFDLTIGKMIPMIKETAEQTLVRVFNISQKN